MVNPGYNINDNPSKTVSTDVACCSSLLFCAREPAIVSLAPIVNASKQTKVIRATTHCATLDKAIFPANKQTRSKIVADCGRARPVTSVALSDVNGQMDINTNCSKTKAWSAPINQGEQVYSHVEPELQSPKSRFLQNNDSAARFDFL